MVHSLVAREPEALAAVDQSLRFAPGNRDSLLLKAQVLEALGRPVEARRVRDEAEFQLDGNWSKRLPVR